jgi:hypothetical protein
MSITNNQRLITNIFNEESNEENINKEKDNRPNIWLDLDLTCLQSIDSNIFKKLPKEVKEYIAKKIGAIKMHDMKDDIQSYYLVFERPGLQEFLDFVFLNFNVNIWTAATKDYAAFIIDKIILQNKKSRKLNYALVHYHTRKSKERYGKRNAKILDMLIKYYKLQMRLNNSLIVDDNHYVKKSQPKICIAAKEFYLFDEDLFDEEELDYKKFLNEEALNDNFFKNLIQGLKKYLQEYELNGQVDDASGIIEPFLGS